MIPDLRQPTFVGSGRSARKEFIMSIKRISEKKDVKQFVRLSNTTIKKLDLLSNKLNKTRSEVIRMILDKSLIYVGVEDENV